MNLRLLFSLLAFACWGATLQAQTGTDPNEGSQLSQDATAGVYTFSWWGKAGRTYFMQESTDLVNWTYFPVIESGANEVIQWSFTSLAPVLFVRLKYSDIPTDDPFDADFDGDGVSNWNELLQGTDPLVANFDVNGLPFDWETFYGIPFGTNSSTLAPNGDGLTLLANYQQGLNPNDFYIGVAPALNIISGNGQTGPPNGFVPAPLIVSVTDGNGNPLVNAPITFTVGQGGGQVQKSSNSSPGTAITVQTDPNGQAKAFFQLPASTNNTSQISAVPGTGNYPVTAQFTESSDGGGGTYASPFDPSNVVASMNSDGSGDVSWTNNADPTDTESIDVMYKDINGHWQVLTNAPAGTTSYHIPAP